MHPLYNILKNRPVKRGPNATVWYARDEVLDREVALKELRGWASRPARALACFQFAHVCRLSLRHPGLAAVHGAVCDRGWLVLDYHPCSLADQTDPLAPEAVRRILGDVATTLDYLHEQGFVHGGVKPANLFGTPQSRILLADGLGIRLGGNDVNAAALLPLDARDGKYLAPECLSGQGEKVGPGVDLYALGFTGLELLLGSLRFASLFPLVQAELLRWDEWHVSEEVLPPLRELLPDAPRDLLDLLTRLTCKDPAQRPDLAATLAVLTPPPATPPVPPATPRVVERGPVPMTLAAPPRKEGPPTRPSWGWLATSVGSGLGGIGLGVAVSLFLPGKGEPATPPEAPPPPAVQARSPEPALPDPQLARLAAHAQQLERDRDAAHLASRKALGQIAEHQAQRQRSLADLANVERLIQAEKVRANHLDGEIKRLQGNVLKGDQTAADLARQLKAAQGEVLKRDQTLADLTRQLKAAQDERARLRADAEKSKAAGLVPFELTPPPDSSSPAAVLANLKRLGAKVAVDTTRADEPIVEVDLTGTNVTDDHLALLSGQASLRVLVLSSTKVGDRGIAHLAKLSNLQTLTLSGTQVSDAGLAHLKGLTGLQTLFLSSTRVGDAGLAHLKGMAALNRLHLSHTRVSDTGLGHLKGLVQLRELYLSFTSATLEGAREMQRWLPYCKIELGPPGQLPSGS